MADRFDKIIILGSGQLFLKCLEYLVEHGIKYDGYETSGKASKLTRLKAEKKGLHYEVEEKKELFRKIASEEEQILLISAINPLIVPNEVLNKRNILALNCHQALLYKYKGRNSESWAIFEGDREAGITWHKMTGDVDGGAILCQKEIPVSEEYTSNDLFRAQIEAAYEAFTEFMPEVLEGKETYEPQNWEQEAEFHYSWEVPANGILNLQWSGEKISCFLRAMDYGVLKVMPYPAVLLDGEERRFKKYKIERLLEPQKDSLEVEEEQITIIREDYKFTLSRLEKRDNGK